MKTTIQFLAFLLVLGAIGTPVVIGHIELVRQTQAD